VGETVAIQISAEDNVQSIAEKLLVHNSPKQGEKYIPKLYNQDGCLIPIGKEIPANEPASKYILKFAVGTIIIN
jgi:hypothetical protein